MVYTIFSHKTLPSWQRLDGLTESSALNRSLAENPNDEKTTYQQDTQIHHVLIENMTWFT